MRAKRSIPLLCAACCLVCLPALGQEPEFMTQTGTFVHNLDSSISASAIQVAIGWVSPAYSEAGGAVNSLQCLATARNRGELKRGLTLTLEGEIYGANEDETLKVLSRKTRPFNPAARFSWDLPDYSSGEDWLAFAVMGRMGGSQQVDVVKVDCRAINRIRCQNSRYTLCAAGNNRFKVQADMGPDQCTVRVTSKRWGWFSMPGSSQDDIYVELFDRCQMNDHYWVAVGSLTGRPFEVVVEDTLSGETRSFSNPGMGMIMFDQGAFATCP